MTQTKVFEKQKLELVELWCKLNASNTHAILELTQRIQIIEEKLGIKNKYAHLMTLTPKLVKKKSRKKVSREFWQKMLR